MKITSNKFLVWTLLIVLCLARFSAALYGKMTNSNLWLTILFVLMAAAPFVFYSREFRKTAKFQKFNTWYNLAFSVFLGGLAAAIIGFIGNVIFVDQLFNWYQYIGESLPTDIGNLGADDRFTYFLIFFSISISLSPVGEEFFFRGVFHFSLTSRYKERVASIIDSTAFAIVHLSHYGLIFRNGEWTFYLLPALAWVILMFLSALLFNFSRQLTNSIYGAVTSHMSFNAVMTYFIFYQIN